MKKCNICKFDNNDNVHYCANCGKNLSNQIEKTDVLFFVSSCLKILAILEIFFVFFSNFIVNLFRALSNDDAVSFGFYYLFCVFQFIVGYLLKKYTLKKCKDNIERK